MNIKHRKQMTQLVKLQSVKKGGGGEREKERERERERERDVHTCTNDVLRSYSLSHELFCQNLH